MTLRSRLALLGHPVTVIAAIVLVGALLSWRYTRHAQEWLVMTDELQYLKLGHSVGDGAFPLPTLRGERSPLLSLLYPVLIAPVLMMFSAPEGYDLVHLVNALLFASTAIPVYLLTRQVVDGRWPAYVAAALAIAVPWASTSAVIMTESASYPAFAWALFAIQRALVTPSPRRDLVALLAIGLAFFARTQFVFLAAAFPALIVLHELLFIATASDRPGDRGARLALLRERLRPHAPLGALVAFGLVLLILPNDPLKRLLGPFETTVLGDVLPPDLAPAMRYQLTLVVGGIAFIPLALGIGWALSSLLRPVDRRSHAFAALSLVVGAALVYVVTVFAVIHAPGPDDRYLFYLVPLPIVATVACLAQGRARPLGLLVGGLFTFWLLRTSGVAFDPSPGITVNSQALYFHSVYDGQVFRIRSALGIDGLTPVNVFSWGVLAAVAVVSLLLARAPRLALAVVGLPLVCVGAAQSHYVSRHLTMLINTSPQGAINSVPLDKRDWIDEALPGSGDVALATSSLSDPYTSQRVWWNVEFWNKRVNRAVIAEGSEDRAPFTHQMMSLDQRSGVITTSDGKEPRYMVFGRNQIQFRPMGRVLAEYRTTIPQDPGLELFDLERPYRARWIANGPSGDGWIVRGTPARIDVFPRTDGRAQTLTVDVDLPVGNVPASPFELRSGGRVARARAFAGTINGDTHVGVCVPGGARRNVYLSTTAVRPLPDGRKVGVHLRGIRVEPAATLHC